jgi:hypothetical protein
MDLYIEIKVSDSINQSNKYERLVVFHANTSIGKALLVNLTPNRLVV